MNDQMQRWDRLASHHPDASVIDPLDTRGLKNHYIACLRNEAILAALEECGVAHDAVMLDFGCGTGGLTKALVGSGRFVAGVDISMGLLKRACERVLDRNAVFLKYDGHALPLASDSVSAAVTWVVLNYILDDAELASLLAEIHRTLRPQGILVAIEQVRSTRTTDLDVWQCRRTTSEFVSLFERAGFAVRPPTIIRYGRLPTTYAVRLGWVPERLFARLRRMEQWIGRTVGVLPWDYCDVRFVMTKV